MQLGYVTTNGRGDTDACLWQAVQALQRAGVALAGTIQSNPRRDDRTRCDMDLHVLPDGPVLRISQDLGVDARGCRLDGAALESAVAACQARLPRASLVVINKFGKHEAQGRGFVPVIAAALDRDLPVLVGVSAMNLPAFLDFAGGLARPLPAGPKPILRWACKAITPGSGQPAGCAA
ncbi:MAG: Protein of unknown function (DUF2478) [Rhodobacteraceae bacterium HLUCCA12]|nr:MAG: Protein of unknown function (DUF2478) [Rhodobacteraceae bacterium HLUCCA12]